MDRNNGANGDANENTPLVNDGSSSGGNKKGLKGRLASYREDDRAWVSYPMGFLYITWAVLASNYVNVLLVFVPVGIALGALGMNPIAVFVVNFFAIVPLAALLSFATEELSVKLGQTIGGLMNATFGNAVELIVCRSLSMRPLIFKLTIDCLGLDRCSAEGRDPHRPGQHARQYSLQYSSRLGMLLPLRWLETPGAVLQLDRCFDHVLSDGSRLGLLDHPCHPLRRPCQLQGAH
jgi:hypothetical protein